MRPIVGLTAAFLLATAVAAYAANVIPTPIVPPNETGENGAGAQQITDTARIKVGSCTVSIAANSSGTCNGAAGVVTVTGLSVATDASATVTVADSKVQAGDMAQCTADVTSATAGSTMQCSGVKVSAGQVIFNLTNTSATTNTGNIPIYFFVNTQGNGN